MFPLTQIFSLIMLSTLLKIVSSIDSLLQNDISSVNSPINMNTNNSSCWESGENQLSYCNGTLVPINSALTLVTTQNATLPNESPKSNALLGLCLLSKLIISDTPIFAQDDQTTDISTCGFMQKRGFCLTESACNLSFVVFIQAKINGSFLTVCSGFVYSENEVVTSPACYSSVNGSNLYVLFSNGQRIKVQCIRDSPFTSCASNPLNIQTSIYVHILVLCSKSPVSAARISTNNMDLTPVMVTPNILCNNASSEDLDFIFTYVILVPVFDTAAGVLAFVPSSTTWAQCSLNSGKIVSNEGSPLINNKCEVIGFLRYISKAFLDIIYATPIVRDILLNPKCQLFGTNLKSIFPCD